MTISHSDVMGSVRTCLAITILLTTAAVADETASHDNIVTIEKRIQSRIEHFTPDSVRIVTHASYAYEIIGYGGMQIDERMEVVESTLDGRFQELKALFSSLVAQKAVAVCSAYGRQTRFIGIQLDSYDMSIIDHIALKPMEDAQVEETYVLSHMFACINGS